MLYRRMLAPAVASDLSRTPPRDAIAAEVRRHNALGAMWTYDWDCGPSPWYFVICDDPAYDVERIPRRKVRSSVRQGLRRTKVRRVEAEWLAAHGHGVYTASHSRYTNATPITSAEFASLIRSKHDSELWGGFVEDQLVAFGEVFEQDGAAFLGTIKFDPSHSNAKPSNSMELNLARHYVVERGCRYFTGGPRPLVHETTVDLFRYKMGWRVVYARLGLYLRAPLRMALACGAGPMARWIGRIPALGSVAHSVQSLSFMARIARACERGENPPDLAVDFDAD
jgi:hypothetical protein